MEEEIEGAPLEAAIEAGRAGRGNQLSKKQGELTELLALHYSQAVLPPVSSIE